MSETEDEIYSFGAWVRRRRKALDLTQAALAQQVGCAEVTIRKLEADAFRPSQEIAQRLAQCLGVPAETQAEFVRVARAEQRVDRLFEPRMALNLDRPEMSARLTPPALYDLFISYAASDQAWVHGFLLDALEQARIRYHCEDRFTPGTLRLLELKQAIAQSRYTVLVLSAAYLTDDFPEMSDLLVQHFGPDASAWRVVPLLRDPVVTLPPQLHMLTALTATDPSRWSEAVERLCSLLRMSAPQSLPKVKCPYPGMVAFGEADHERFYGRDREVDALIAQLRLHPFLTVIGPSGSGKSSLVFAGLVPALKRSGLFGDGAWIVESLRPGEAPLAALGAVLHGDPTESAHAIAARLAHQPAASQLLVIVDQFEEIFTVARQDVEAFQMALLHLAQVPQCYVVLTVRADFYADLMASRLWPTVQAHRLEVVPLDESGLRQAIVRPAEALGVCVEPALVERLITDAAGEPGVLPLVQETLVLLWERLERRFLPLSAYHALVHTGSNSGPGSDRTGLQVAMARRADNAVRSLSPDQHRIGRRVFLRLIQFGEGRADTRRQQAVDGLRAIGDDPDQFETTLHHLITRRLLTASGHEDGSSQKVDIAHEALISGWPTLQQWLVERRDAEQTRRRLETKANEWVRLGRRNGGLLDDVELLEAERWLQSPDAADLGYDATLVEFIQVSRSGQTERLVHQRQVARFRRLALSVIVLLIITALSIGLWSMQQSLDFARQQARISTASQLTAQSQVELERYPQRSLLLSVEAVSMTLRVNEPPVLVSQEALRQALASTSGYALNDQTESLWAVAISSDGRWVVAGDSDGVAHVWDLKAADPAAHPLILRGYEGPIQAVAFSSNSRWLVTTSQNTARVWDLKAADPAAHPLVLDGLSAVAMTDHWLVTASPGDRAQVWDLKAADLVAQPLGLEEYAEEEYPEPIWAVDISSDNRLMVAASNDGPDGTVRVWDLKAIDRDVPLLELPWHEGMIRAVTISSNNRWLVTAREDGTARVWDLNATDRDVPLLELSGISAVTISNNNRWLVMADDDATARVWDLENPAAKPRKLWGHEGPILAVTISSNNRWLVTASEDGTARVWDLNAEEPAMKPLELRGHESAILALAFSNDNEWLVTASDDGTVRRWDFQTENTFVESILLQRYGSLPQSIVMSNDNRWLVVGDNHMAQVWDLTALDSMAVDLPARPLEVWGHEGRIWAAAITDHWLVTAGEDETARVWNLNAADPTAKPLKLRGHEGRIWTAAISSDNRWLVTAGEDKTAHIWDLNAADPESPVLDLLGHEGPIRTVAISSDNRLIVTASDDGTARVWDVTVGDPAAERRVLQGHEGPIWAAAISNDSRWLVTAGDDATARVWDLKNLTAKPLELREHEGRIWKVTISNDNRWLVTAGWDGMARVWDLQATDRDVPVLKLPDIRVAVISSDNRWLVTAGEDGTAQVWNLPVESIATPMVLRGHEGPIRTVAISSDNRWLVTGGEDGLIQLWPLSLDDLRARACRAAGRNLTRAEWAQYMPKDEPYRATCENFPIEPVKQDATPTAAPAQS